MSTLKETEARKRLIEESFGGMTPPTFRPSAIYLEIDVSGLSLIDAEKYFNDLRGGGFPMPDGCSARGMMDVEEVEE